MRIKFTAIILVAMLFLLYADEGYSYSTFVHKKIANKSINESQLLQKSLREIGFRDVEDYIDNKTIRQWIEEGSIKEDDLLFPVEGIRFLNHFYNPLTNSGLSDFPFYGISSYEWASQLNNFWSWKWTRDYFYKGLTKPTEVDRNKALADSFRALGQLIHLIQDTASPAHVRNDAHPEGDLYEAYTRANAENLSYTSISFPYWNVSISSYVPKQFWDLESYDGSVAYDSGYIGLAEYTNANFFSKDTMYRNFPHPYVTLEDFGLLPITVITTPWNISHNTFYIAGYGKKHLAAFKYFGEELWNLPLPLPVKKYQLGLFLDNRCHEEYASQLIPRAVGYSAGLLNYFFRGDIDMVSDDATGSGYVIVNNSDEDMNGTFELFYDNAGNQRVKITVPAMSAPITIGKKSSVNNKSPNITFSSPSDAKKPGEYMLVFKGNLGKEEGAVVGEIVELEKDYLFLVNLNYQTIAFEIRSNNNQYQLIPAPKNINITRFSMPSTLLTVQSHPNKRSCPAPCPGFR